MDEEATRSMGALIGCNEIDINPRSWGKLAVKLHCGLCVWSVSVCLYVECVYVWSVSMCGLCLCGRCVCLCVSVCSLCFMCGLCLMLTC